MNRRDFIKYGTVFAGACGVCLLCKNGQIFNINNSSDIKTEDNRPCKRPFINCEIHPKGNVYSCCPGYLKTRTPAGNIEEQDLAEIWNGEILTDLRQRVLKGDYSLCNRDICGMYMPCSVDEIPSDYEKGPQDLKIGYDLECNYRCITCRDTVITDTPEELEFYNNVYLPKILKIAENLEFVSSALNGDALSSRHSRQIIKKLAEEYSHIKFNLFTNGLLLDEENIRELGIQDKICGLSVSVDAVNRKTYNEILRTDAFDTVMKNLKLMSEWKKQGKIEWITINFVVHLLNYKEMPAFAKLAKKLDVRAFFSTYQPWYSAKFHERYNEVAVFEPENEHYEELVKILHNPVFKDKIHVHLEPRLYDIVYS